MTDDEQLARNGAGRHGVRAGNSAQQDLQREGVCGHHGDPWPHAASIFAQLQHETTPRAASIASRDASAEHEGAPLQVSSRCVTKRQQRAILRRPMHAKDLHAKDLRATDMRALRFALAITWAVYQAWASGALGSAAKRERKLIPRTAMFFRRSRRASARHCSHHGSSPWLRDAEIFGQDLDEQLCCREHNPRHEQGRARKQQEIIEDLGHHIPHAHGPMHRRRARTGRRRDGDTSNLAHNARRFDWFPIPQLFFTIMFSLGS